MEISKSFGKYWILLGLREHFGLWVGEHMPHLQIYISADV